MSRSLDDVVAERLALLPFAATPHQLLMRDGQSKPTLPGARSANGACRLLRASDDWLAVNLARPNDAELVPALSGSEDEPWRALATAAKQATALDFVARGVELHLPIAALGEARPAALARQSGSVRGLRVVDLSALWAGPLCAGLLAKAGADVLRIDNLARPDPTPRTAPALDRWLNGGKRVLTLDLRSEAGKARLVEELAGADAVVTSARPRALASLGVDDELLAARPGLIWAAVTAHGWAANRVGFGDDCAVAGGLVEWDHGAPGFLGDALADPLTGLEGALAVLARANEGRGGRIDLRMAGIAAAYHARMRA